MQWLEPGQGVFPGDLEEAARRQGVRVRSGDAVLLRTGATLKPAEVADFLHRRPEPLALARLLAMEALPLTWSQAQQLDGDDGRSLRPSWWLAAIKQLVICW